LASNSDEITTNDSSKEVGTSRSIYDEEDSIEIALLNEILLAALDSVKVMKTENCYYKEYKPINDYTEVEVTISNNFHFTNNARHIVIRRNGPLYNYINIYNNKDLSLALNHKHWGMTYTGDTIFDVNGDNRKDFVVNWYGSTGCCLKGFSDVYLSNSKATAFSRCYTFINPTFSPNEHIIRGICYGHPGDTEMYKYKWNGERVDTMEYVMFEKDTSGSNIGVIISKQRNTEPVNIIRKQKYVPVEYKSINDFGWFMDN
jgi:hypothetical protein